MTKISSKKTNRMSRFYRLSILWPIFFLWTHSYSQNWSPWTNLVSSYDNSIQYCYKLYPVTKGNSFSLKIKNNSRSNVCGRFEVVLNMVNGEKKVYGGFDDLKPGVESSCYGVYQFSEVQSFLSMTNIKITTCKGETSIDKSPPASFTIDFHNDASKSGKLKYVDPTGQFSFEAEAFSGLQNASNNPYSQSFKNQGLIPSGIWKIELITEPKTVDEKRLNEHPPIFRLTPVKDVELSSLKTDQMRDGFLIHSGLDPLTASEGCIIMDKASRLKLKYAISKYGPIELKVQNRVY